MSQNNGIQLNNVTVERGEGGLVTLTIEVAADSVQTMRERVIKGFAKRLRIPGFRPGHAPANLVRRNVGDEAIAQEVSDQIVPKAYQAAIDQENVKPLERGEVAELTFDAFDGDRPLVFTARVIGRPEITLGNLEGLTATQPTVNVTDEDVEAAIDRMREERAFLLNAPERGAENGDIIFADVQVYIDGEARSEEPTKLRGFVLGESGFVPAIDEHLIGQNLDETRRFTVTYPEDFQDAELAGKEGEFEVKITAIKLKQVPELTDEFAQISGASDVEDLKVQLRQYLVTSAERDARRATREQLVQAAVEGSTLEVPTALVEVRLQERVQNITNELQQKGATLEAYLANIGSTQEEMENDLREEITNELKSELVLDEIATREDLPVYQQEVENHYLMMAQMMQRPIEDLVQNLPVANVRTSILQRKAIDWIAERAVITDEQGNPISLDVPALEDDNEDAEEEAVAEAVLAASESE